MRITTTLNLKTWRNLMFFSFAVFLFSCSKSNSGGSTNSAIVAFSFQQSNNPIPVNTTGGIDGSSIIIFLPPGTNVNALKATYTLSDSANVTVNGVAQTSGITPNDFSNPVTYTVTAQNGTVKTYTVTLTTGISAIDNQVSAFMAKYNVPGLAIAVSLNDQLIYVNSYGKASVEDNQAVTSQSLFRISSLSKAITSAAIMKLIDMGKINMEQPVFGDNGILGNTFGTQPYGPGITSITVGQLLHHTEGGWPDDNTDPTGKNPSQTIDQMISWGLDNVPLLNPTPGQSFYYSHFGYVILGRVIEKVTGQSYAAAVQTLILQPAGISDMKIAGDALSDRLPNEVKYYNSEIDPYSVLISRMDAANGWVASATDMARFMSVVDGLSSKTILSQNAITIMSTASTANTGYACGWEVNQLNWWHDGDLPGTQTTEAITTQNGNFNYVVLTNTSSSDPNYKTDLGNIFWNAVPNVPAWPNYDLFQGQ